MVKNFSKMLLIIGAFYLSGCDAGKVEGNKDKKPSAPAPVNRPISANIGAQNPPQKTTTTATTAQPPTSTATTSTVSQPSTASAPGSGTKAPAGGAKTTGVGGGKDDKGTTKLQMTLLLEQDPTGKTVSDLLLDAAQKGNLQVFEAFKEVGTVEKQKEILAQENASQRNALHLAAQNGKEEVVKYVLQLQKDLTVDLDKPDFQGFYPIHLAAYGGHEKVLKAMLDIAPNKDVLLDRFDSNNLRPVDYAATHGSKKALEVFFTSDNDIFNKQNKQGNNALFKCIQSNECSYEIAEYIIGKMNKDSLSLITANEKRNVLHSAAINGKAKEVGALLKRQKELGLELDVEDKAGFSPFFLSAYFGHGLAIQAFLDNADKEALLTKVDGKGLRAVDYAAAQGKSGALEVFHKADGQIFNKKNKRDKTALYEAVISNKTSKDAVNFILANTNQNLKNGCETTEPCKIYAAIHAAAHNDTVSADILELLLNDLTPAQLDAEDQHGWTPLRYAILSMNEDKVEKMLKSKKVDINKKSFNITPLQYAIQMPIEANVFDSGIKVLKKQLGLPDGWGGNQEQTHSPAKPKEGSSWEEKYVYDVYNRLKTEDRRLKMVELFLKHKPNLEGSFGSAAKNHDLEILAILDKEDLSLKNEMGAIGENMPANNAVVMAIDFAISDAVSKSKSKNTYTPGNYTLQNQALGLVEKRTIATLDKLKELGLSEKAFSANILIDKDGKEILWAEPIMYSLKAGQMVTKSWYWSEIQNHLKKLSATK